MEKDPWRRKLTLAVAVVITAVWTVSFIVDIFSESYSPPASITPLMLAVAGYCFSDGISVWKKKDSSEEVGHEQA